MAPATQHLLRALALGLVLSLPAAGRAEAPDPRIEAGVQLYRAQGAAQALPLFEQLATEFAGTGRAREEAAALHYVGECLWRLGDFAGARARLDQALVLQAAAGDQAGRARSLNVLGLVAWDEGEYDPAMGLFRQAGEIARALGDRKLEGAALNNLSLVQDEQGEYDISIEQYRRVLELYRDADFPRGVGDTLGNIGGVHLLLGRFREALGYYQQALEISERLESTISMSQDHGNIGLCLLGLGRIDEALAHLDQAAELAAGAGMRQDEAYWLRVKADGLVEKGDYDLGLQSYRTALAVYEKIGARAELVEALQGYGQAHLLLGDLVSAERDFTRAIEIARTIRLERGITNSLVWLGDLEYRRDRPEAALALYEQARQRASEAKARHLLALSLLRLARVHRSLGELNEAAARTEEALAAARDTGTQRLAVEALYARAEISRLEGRNGPAIEGYQAAEQAGAGAGDPELLWQIQFGRARAQEAAGDIGGALESLEAAIRTIEGVRSRLQEPRFRSGYIEDKFEVYFELVRLLLQQGRIAEAFTTAERVRAWNFVEQIGGRASVPLSPGDRRTEAELRERVRRLSESLLQTDDEGARAYPDRALERFSEELRLVENEYTEFLDNRVRIRDVAHQPPTAASIQERLGLDEALVEYVVGRENLVVFVLTARDIGVKFLPVSEPDLTARIALLRDLVQSPGDERWRRPASRLSAQLIEPIETAGWLDGVTRLLIVPHGPLAYLPFALLPASPGQDAKLLIDSYILASLPAAAAMLGSTHVDELPRSLLAVAPARGRLSHAMDEARAIDAMFRPASTTLLGRDATEARFKALAGDFRVLHMATHGHFNEANPLLSGLELEPDRTEDGMLRVHEILDLRLKADIVTLSACDTALGSGYFKAMPRGEEFVAMNRAFLSAGSASVLATLWKVDDRASVSLMKNFYAGLRLPGSEHDAASALAIAQRNHRRSRQLGHPYYWASYIVVGHINNTDVRVAAQAPGETS
jgi:CHAT domain-containing protein